MHFRHQPGGGYTAKQQQGQGGGQFNFVGGGGGGGGRGVAVATRNDSVAGSDYSADKDKDKPLFSSPGGASSPFPSAVQQLIFAGKKNMAHKCGDAPPGDENDCLGRPAGAAATSSLSSMAQLDVVGGGHGLAARRPQAAAGGGDHGPPSDGRRGGTTAVGIGKKRNSDGFVDDEDEDDGNDDDGGGDVDKYFSDLFGDSSSSPSSASLRPKQPPPRNPEQYRPQPAASRTTTRRRTWENPLISLLSKLRDCALKSDASGAAAAARGAPSINGRRGGVTPTPGPSPFSSAQQQQPNGGGRRRAAARMGEGILVLGIVMLLFSGLQINSMTGHNAEGMRRIKSRYRQNVHEEGRDRPNSAAYLRAVNRHKIKAGAAAAAASGASPASARGERMSHEDLHRMGGGGGGAGAAAPSDAIGSNTGPGDGATATTHADKMMSEQRRQQELLEKAQQQLKDQQEQQDMLLRQQREQLEFQKRLEEQQREQERQRQQLLEQRAQASQAADRPPSQQGVAEQQPQKKQQPPPPPQQPQPQPQPQPKEQQQQTNTKTNTNGGNDVELLPPSFRNLADFPSEPIPNGQKSGGDVAVLWYVHHAGGSAFREIMGGCMGMTLASEVGAQFGHASDQTLQVFEKRGSKYVNVDTTSPAGLAKAKNLNLASSGLPDVVITPFVHEASELFTPDHRGRMFAVLRDPVDRAVSMYGHMVKNNPSLSGMTIEEYARSDRVENNWMVRFLANAKTGSITNDHLVMAAEVLRTKFLIGLSDRKEETMERFRKYFGWSLVNMDSIEGRRECIGKLLTRPNEDEAVPERVEQGTRAYSLLQWQNQYDVKLFKYAQKLFEQQKEFV